MVTISKIIWWRRYMKMVGRRIANLTELHALDVWQYAEHANFTMPSTYLEFTEGLLWKTVH